MDEDYDRLRTELEAAYAAPVWDSARIDRIAAEMAHVELALAMAKRASAGAHHG